MNRRLKTPITPSQIDVALSWLQGQRTLKEASVELKMANPLSGNGLYRVALLLREAHRQGVLVINQEGQ